MRDIVRYDAWHGYFHCHTPDGEIKVVEVPEGMDQIRVALDDLNANADSYIEQAIKSGWEVPDDADASE